MGSRRLARHVLRPRHSKISPPRRATVAETAYYYLQGFDFGWRWFSPGTQILGAVIEDALREGKKKIDFLRGRESYKYLWGASDEPTFRLSARCGTRTQIESTRVAA